MEHSESVSDSELDFNRDVFVERVIHIARRTAKARRSSVGCLSSSASTNHRSRYIPAQTIIDLIKAPSVQTYTAIKKKIDKTKNEPGWILEFLNKDGLDLLFESLEQLCNSGHANFVNVILQASCAKCVLTIMDSTLSLDYIIENKDLIKKISSVLDSDNVAVKQEVLKLLSALCVYSKDGYARALEVLEHHKVSRKSRYRFSYLVEELRRSESPAFKSIVLGFINCIVIYTDSVQQRIRIRNEFYGVKLQEVLNQIRPLAEKDQGLETQLDLFEEHRDSDDEQLPGAKGIDLNSPLDVFNAIYKQVGDTPQELHFLTVLQNLLKIDSGEASSELVWSAVETLVGKATVIESAEDSKKLLQSFTKRLDSLSENKCTCACHSEGERNRMMSPRRTSGVAESDGQPPVVPPHKKSDVKGPAPPPPPPPASFFGAAPPPPAPPTGMTPPPPPPMAPGGFLPPAPPPMSFGTGTPGFFQQKKLPQQNIPKPKSKMRTFQWQKIPVNKVVGKNNIWTMTGQVFNGYVNKMDYGEIEDLFGLNKVRTSQDAGDEANTHSTGEKKKKEPNEVNLLDGKRSLNVNIFLKQFRMANEEIVTLVQAGQSDRIGAEKLRNLLKILPTQEEVDNFRSFDGDRTKLGSAEKFFMCLMGLPNYRLRIEGLTIREEFMANMEFIKPSIDSIIEAAKDIKENKNLHELLYLVLLAGNFLNAGNYAGDAAGFKLSSLLKLTEIRANKPRMNLLHYVVMQAEEKNPALLNFPDEMKFLKDASIASVDALAADIKALDEKVAKISQNVEMVGKDFEKQMNEFLGIARKEMQELNEDLVDMEGLRIELADFFCEDEKTFKLEECFRIFQTFCERFSKAKQENAQRKDNEKKMETRRLQREAEVQKRNDADAADVTVTVEHGDGNVNIVDQLLADVRMGFKKFDEASFSVTKVQKINLGAGQNQDSLLSPTADGIGTGFVRGGSGRRSVRGVKSRKSVADGDSDSTDGQSGSGSGETGNMLFDILMQPETEPGLKTPVTEGSFSRMGSLRRRRSDRKMQGNNFGIAFERERVPSPNIEAQEKEILDTKERPKSDILDDNFDYRQGSNLSVRRSRSMNERAVLESPSRMYDPNNNKSEDNLLIERTKSPSFRSDDPHRRSSRWRNDIPDVKGLPIIEERDRNTNLVEQTSASSEYVSITDKVTKDDSFAIAEKKTKEKLSRRFSSTMLDHVEIRRVLETAEDVKNKTDEHTVAMTQRAKTNKRWVSELDKTDIDNVLKAIEETEIKIGETVKVESSVHRQSKEVVTASIQSPKEVVTASLIGPNPIDAKVVPQGDPKEPQHLKEKRKNRKKRSVLSMEDIHAAFTKTKTPDVENKTSEFENKENHELPQKSPKSPQVPPRRSRRNSDGSIEKLPEVEVKPEQTIVDKDVVSKAAKLAGKKRFRDQRFGDKETPAQKAMLEHSQGRWKSNVEKDNVDEAYRDYMNKNNMSRSKSYDEAVARKALEDESDNNAINTEKRNSLRSSAVNMYNDDRRNGKIFDDESEGDNSINITSSPRRPSSTNSTRSDSPKSSSSRLSIKSTNTSTETLRETGSDNETSPSQRRKNSTPNGITDKQYKFQVNERRPETPSSLNYLLANKVDDHSLENFEARVSFDENDDLPQAKMLKWRKQRTEKRRTGNYENVPGFDGIVSGNLSPRIEMKPESVINSPRSDSSSQGSIPIIHKTQGSFELQNDIGSRCSYASSSDSASKDEGFETMSGTVSQRTSLSSALESVDIIPGINKKFESLSKLQINENIIAEAARSSVIDTKKERTESWTEAVAVGMVNKDGSLDSSMEFNALSPDSGHGTLKEEPWQESDIIKESSEERPMSPASVHSSDKKEKKVPSYMRGTASSSKKRGQESEHDSSANLSTTNRISKGASNHNLSRARTNSNSSIVSATSNVSDSGTISPVKRRVSHGTPKERPSSIHSSMPLSRSTTPLPSSVRAQTPTNRGVAAKPATHASSTIGARLSTSSTKTLKARPAPAPPTGRKTPTPTTPARTSSKSSTSTPGRTTPVSNNRSVTPNPTRNRSTTPVDTLSHTPIRRSNSPTIEEEECEIDPNGPSPLRRTQSMRVKSGTSRPAVGSVMSSKEAPEKSSTPRRSFMSPTASSKARVDKLKAEDENSTPPIPPPRRSKDTDALPSKSDTTPSPLKRHASMRVPDKAANKAPKDQDKASDSKLKGFIQKIGGSGSKVRPVSDCSGKLAPVDENAEKDGAEELPPKEGGKSPSLRRIFGLKSKEKQVRKSTDSLKSESADVKKKSLK